MELLTYCMLPPYISPVAANSMQGPVMARQERVLVLTNTVGLHMLQPKIILPSPSTGLDVVYSIIPIRLP